MHFLEIFDPLVQMREILRPEQIREISGQCHPHTTHPGPRRTATGCESCLGKRKFARPREGARAHAKVCTLSKGEWKFFSGAFGNLLWADAVAETRNPNM